MKNPDLIDIDKMRRKGFRPQIVGCFVHDKKVLFFYDKKYELWQFPQGGVDNGETLEKALKREMEEELGLKNIESMKVYSLIDSYKLNFGRGNENFKSLKTDNGLTVNMIGKRYFFYAIELASSSLDIDLSEFDRFKWEDYKTAIETAKSIHQPGKKKISLIAVKALKSKRFIG